MHRMGSYFDPSPSNSLQHSHHNPNPIKSILTLNNAPPTPPPTSSIPSKRVARYGTKPVDRIKRNIARLRHQQENEDLDHIHALNKRLASLTIADMSPPLVLQRILALFERGEHREAAAFIRRVSAPTYRQVAAELPLELFVDSMPRSLPILEAVYAKVYLGSANGTLTMKGRLGDKFGPETVVWQIVRFFATHNHHTDQSRLEMCGPWVSTCKRLLSVLLSAEPRIRRVVAERRRALTRAIEGLGQHGMVGTSSQQLLGLHDALRSEFGAVQRTHAEAVAKLDSISHSGSSKPGKSNKSSSSGPPPVAQSHQRQLSLRVASEIQERLIKQQDAAQRGGARRWRTTSLEVLTWASWAEADRAGQGGASSSTPRSGRTTSGCKDGKDQPRTPARTAAGPKRRPGLHEVPEGMPAGKT